MLASLSPTPQSSRGQMWEVCVPGESGTKENKALFFPSERPKEGSENIRGVSQYMRRLCGTCVISMHAAALECAVCFPSQALGGGLTEVTPSQSSLVGNCVTFHRHATTPAHVKLRWMCVRVGADLFVIHKVLKTFSI